MSEENDIKQVILSLVGLLMLMIIIPASNSTFQEQEDVEQILIDHNFSGWSIEDKAILTEMVRLTVDPVESNEQFNDLVISAPRYVLETYIALMENAGY